MATTMTSQQNGVGQPLHWVAVFSLFLLAILLSPVSQAQDKTYIIGVLAKRGSVQAKEKWSATADFLTAQVDGAKFELLPLSFDEVPPVVATGEVDFLIANPSIYVEMETLYGASRIATLKNLGPDGQILTVFGGVILVKADRNDIQKITDLKKISSFMAVKETSLGGFQVAWQELLKSDIDPYSDFNRLVFRSKHDAVVLAVGNREVDAGTVRTDTLERMAAEGKINIDDFKVIGAPYGEYAEGFPYKASTMLMPEWPFAKMAHTPDVIAQKVAIALLSMSPDDPAAISGKMLAGQCLSIISLYEISCRAYALDRFRTMQSCPLTSF